MSKKPNRNLQADQKTIEMAEGNTVNVNRGKAKGRSGNYYTSGVFSEDHITTLQGINGMIQISKMLRSDAQCLKIRYAITNPIKSATWDIPPISQDTKDIEAASLMKKIIFKNKNKKWSKLLSEILTFPFYGHAVFEKTFFNVAGDIEYGDFTSINMAFRNQTTLEKWNYDNTTETLVSVKQRQFGDLEVDIEIPASDLVIFYNDQTGNDPGLAIMRNLYGQYIRKLTAKQLQMIGIERSAIPVPQLEVPDDILPDSKEYIAAEANLSSFTNAENAYIMHPKGWKLTLDCNNTFDPEKVQRVIKAEDEDMSGAILATFLELGVGGNSGAYALGKGLADFFLAGIEYMAKSIVDTFNMEVIPVLMKLNYADGRQNPQMAVSGISDKAGKDLMETVTGYTTAGVITKDEILEDYIRKVHNLPKKAEGALEDNQETSGPDKEVKKGEVKNVDEIERKPIPATSDGPTVNLSELNANNVVKLEEGAKTKPAKLMLSQGEKISEILRTNLKFTSDKMIADIMRKYAQLPDNKKIKALDGLVIGGKNQLKAQLKGALTSTASLSLDQVKGELDLGKSVKLKSSDKDIKRLSDIYGDLSSFKLTDYSKLPEHVRLLIAKQTELIAERMVGDLEERISFQFMSADRSSADAAIVKQELEDVANKYLEMATIDTAAQDVSAVVANEMRSTYFYAPEVREEIHSFTYHNDDPKTDICMYLNGLTVAANDEASLQYTPPLHHNCKTYLVANLIGSKTAKQVDEEESIQVVAPTEKMLQSITLKEGKK